MFSCSRVDVGELQGNGWREGRWTASLYSNSSGALVCQLQGEKWNGAVQVVTINW